MKVTQVSDDFVNTHEEPHMIIQAELNDLARDLNLSKSKAELLGSRLQQWRLVHYDLLFRSS